MDPHNLLLLLHDDVLMQTSSIFIWKIYNRPINKIIDRYAIGMNENFTLLDTKKLTTYICVSKVVRQVVDLVQNLIVNQEQISGRLLTLVL